MSLIEVKIPSPGESITQVELFHWLVEDGSVVKKNTEIAELESDKATLMLVAEESGKISFKAAEGDMIDVGSVACTIDTSENKGLDKKDEIGKAGESKQDNKQKESAIKSEEKSSTLKESKDVSEKIPEKDSDKKVKPQVEHEKVKIG